MIVLQKFGFKESKYERPQDAWVCGHLADGKPCDLGPGLDGRCRVTTVCQPRLENERWQCRRSASAGGPCQAGPLPGGRCCMALERCVPRPSLRRKRKRSVFAATALMIGVLAIGLGGEAGRQFMMPGKLSSHHAGLTDCSTCHAGGRSDQADLLHRLVTTVEPRQNSNLCVTCHVMGADPFTPHTHPVEDLKRLTETLRSDPRNGQLQGLMQRIAFPAATGSPAAEMEMNCATCHKEHQGVFANLKEVSNQRCQTCHVSKYDSFTGSHPQFTNFPYHRRPRVIFDHQTHMAKYFPEAVKAAVAGQVAPDSCSDCHQPGVRQKFMVVKSFTTMCSGCHNGDITGATQVSGPKGIEIISVPGLDVATLIERGIDIGAWPKESEATLTPFMLLLLESNGGDVVSGIAGLDLLDLRKASDQDLERVKKLAWAVKQLFDRLETTNPAAARVLAGSADPKKQSNLLQIGALTGGMSHDVVVAGNHEWFPDLKDDLQRHDRGEPTRDFKPPAKAPANAAKSSNPQAGGGGNAVATKKTPRVAAASDDILASGGSAPGKKDDILAPGGSAASKKDDILAPGGSAAGKKDDILAPGGSAASKKDDILASGSNAASKKDDILAPGNSDAILATNNKDDILSGDKAEAGNILSGGGGENALGGAPPKRADTDAGAGAKKSADAPPARFDPEVWSENGGWYREDFTIRYRPTGHADRFLESWLDYAGSGYGPKLHDQLTPIFDELASREAVGRCTKCHSVDDVAGAKIINWRPFNPNTIGNRFNNYSHKPHVELIGAKTCVKCHELQQGENQFQKTYESGDPANYTPNFKHLDKSVCASCHSQQVEWENCTLCHGYHVRGFDSSSPIPTLPVAFDQPAVAAAAAPSDPDAVAHRDYMMAEDAGTRQAWEDFIANHPSGPYHEMALQQIAKLSSVGPDKSAATPPDSSAKVTVEKPPAVKSDELPTATPGQSATVTPGDSASSDSAKSASADTSEPNDATGFYRRGRERAVRGEFELAVKDYNEVIRSDPRNAGALNDRCWVLAMLDEVKAALKDCDESLRVKPNYPEALDSRGLVNLKLGLYKKAIADYTSALLYDPKRASALYGRGIAKRRSGQGAGAKSDIDTARSIQPTIVGEFASYGIQ